MKSLQRSKFWKFWPGVLLILAFPFALTWDGQIFVWSQTLGRDTDHFFQTLTLVGHATWMLVLTAGVALTLFVAAKLLQQHKFHTQMGDLAQKFTFVFVSIAGVGAITAGAKYLIGRARPTHFTELGAYHLSPLTIQADFASFPSGHSTNIFALAFALCVLLPQARIPLLILASGIAFSRVAIGAHFMSDIVAGAFVSFLFVMWWQRRAELKKLIPTRMDGISAN